MGIETPERGITKIPFLARFYRQNAATLKRRYCLLLHRFGLLRPFTFVQWLATNQCNFSCPFCETSSGKAGPGELSSQEARGLIDDLSGMGVARLVVSGGEPLMRKDIAGIMAYANKRGLEIGLVTNGWFVPEMENILTDIRFFLYFTSLDGVPAYHDRSRNMENAFVRAMGGLDLFARMGVRARLVNTVVHPGNIGQLEEMVDIVKHSGATSWRLTPVAKVGRAEKGSGYDLSGEELRYLANFIRERRKTVNVDFGESHTYLGCFAGFTAGNPFFCGAGLTRCSIMPDGEVLGCHQIFDASKAEGNIRERSFPQIWKEGFARFRKKEYRCDCRDCIHFSGCRGGCWAEMEKRGSCMKALWNEGK